MKLFALALSAALSLAASHADGSEQSAVAVNGLPPPAQAASATGRVFPAREVASRQSPVLAKPISQDRASATTIADAIQLIQLGERRVVVVEDDPSAIRAIREQLRQKTRVRTFVREVEDLGGSGCKRIEMAFVALDLPVLDKGVEQGLWTVVMQWNLCEGGMPPEPL